MATKNFFFAIFVGRQPAPGTAFYGISDAANIFAVVYAASLDSAKRMLEGFESSLADEFSSVACGAAVRKLQKSEVTTPPFPLRAEHMQAAKRGAVAAAFCAATDDPGEACDVGPLTISEAQEMLKSGMAREIVLFPVG